MHLTGPGVRASALSRPRGLAQWSPLGGPGTCSRNQLLLSFCLEIEMGGG